MRSKRIGHSTELGKPEGTLETGNKSVSRLINFQLLAEAREGGVLEKEGFAGQDYSSVRRPNRSARLL